MSRPRQRTAPTLRPRLRVQCGGETALGPGKADLLDQIDRAGSLAAAAAAMDMSYMRAWTLVKTMNACFREPLVALSRGGPAKGGAALTPAGREVLALYRAMETAALAAADEVWRELRGRLRR
jgi:molybdate transport system regulatory protein